MLLGSCKNSDAFLEKESGEVQFVLFSSDSDNETATKSSVDVDFTSFKIDVVNSQGVTFKREKFSDILGESIPMNVGNYVVRAYSGDSISVGFDAIYLLGENSFVVEAQTNTDVSVVCKQGNVKVAVKYGTNLSGDYTSYRTTIQSGDREALEFKQDEIRAGYVPCGEIVFKLHVVDPKTGKNMVYKSVPYLGKPADFITFRIETNPLVVTEMELSLTIDSTTFDLNVEVMLPSGLLPKDPPTMVNEGFDELTNSYSIVEGVRSDALAVNLNSEAGITACKMIVNSPSLTALGWPSEIDFINITPEVKAVLEGTGLSWTDGMTGLRLAKIDFRGISERVLYTDEASKNSLFTIIVGDRFGQTDTTDYTLAVEQSQISTDDVFMPGVWTKEATVTLNVIAGNTALVFPEISLNGTDWIAPTYEKTISDNKVVVRITGLNPNVNYSVRAGYNNNRTEGKGFATEAELQILNSGFEDWSDGIVTHKPFLGGTCKRKIYYPFASNETRVWDSNNWQTMDNMETAGSQNFKFFPTTSWTAGRTGGNAAQIMSVAVSGWNSSVLGDGATQGKLFLGQMNSSGDITSEGLTFASRPTKIKFYYKFAPYNGESFSAKVQLMNGTTLIGEGYLISKVTVGEWTETATLINYVGPLLSATSIRVLFLSSTSGNPSCSKRNVTVPEGTYQIYGGSCLTVDDVSLVYEK